MVGTFCSESLQHFQSKINNVEFCTFIFVHLSKFDIIIFVHSFYLSLIFEIDDK